jgi:hypothetical protein
MVISWGCIDEYSHRKRAGALNHRHKGKLFYGESKRRVIQESLAEGATSGRRDTHAYLPSQSISEYMIADKDNKHPLHRATQYHYLLEQSATRGRQVIGMVKKKSHHSRRADIRSGMAHGISS